MRGLSNSLLPRLKPLRRKSLMIGISVSVHVIWLVWSEPPPSLQLVAQQSEARQFTLPCKGVLYRSAMRLLSRFKYVSEGICILRKVHQTFFLLFCSGDSSKKRILNGQADRKRWPPPPPAPCGQLFVNFWVYFWPDIMIIGILERILLEKKSIFIHLLKSPIPSLAAEKG